jgi:hypothetical protein
VLKGATHYKPMLPNGATRSPFIKQGTPVGRGREGTYGFDLAGKTVTSVTEVEHGIYDIQYTYDDGRRLAGRVHVKTTTRAPRLGAWRLDDWRPRHEAVKAAARAASSREFVEQTKRGPRALIKIDKAHLTEHDRQNFGEDVVQFVDLKELRGVGPDAAPTTPVTPAAPIPKAHQELEAREPKIRAKIAELEAVQKKDRTPAQTAVLGALRGDLAVIEQRREWRAKDARKAEREQTPVTPKPEKPAFKVGDKVKADEGAGEILFVRDGNVKIALRPGGALTNWIPASRVTRDNTDDLKRRLESFDRLRASLSPIHPHDMTAEQKAQMKVALRGLLDTRRELEGKPPLEKRTRDEAINDNIERALGGQDDRDWTSARTTGLSNDELVALIKKHGGLGHGQSSPDSDIAYWQRQNGAIEINEQHGILSKTIVKGADLRDRVRAIFKIPQPEVKAKRETTPVTTPKEQPRETEPDEPETIADSEAVESYKVLQRDKEDALARGRKWDADEESELLWAFVDAVKAFPSFLDTISAERLTDIAGGIERVLADPADAGLTEGALAREHVQARLEQLLPRITREIQRREGQDEFDFDGIAKASTTPVATKTAAKPEPSGPAAQAITAFSDAVDYKQSLGGDARPLGDKERAAILDSIRQGEYVIEKVQDFQPGIVAITFGETAHPYTEYVRTDAAVDWPLEEKPKASAPVTTPAQSFVVPEGYRLQDVSQVKDAEEARIKGGKYTVVAQRISPFTAERGYGGTPDAARADALRRVGAFGASTPVTTSGAANYAVGDRVSFTGMPATVIKVDGHKVHVRTDVVAAVGGTGAIVTSPKTLKHLEVEDETKYDAAARGKAYEAMTDDELRELLDIGVGEEPQKAAIELTRRQPATAGLDLPEALKRLKALEKKYGIQSTRATNKVHSAGDGEREAALAEVETEFKADRAKQDLEDAAREKKRKEAIKQIIAEDRTRIPDLKAKGKLAWRTVNVRGETIWRPIAGKPVEIPNAPKGLTFTLSNTKQIGGGNHWVVTEDSTGLAGSHAKTQAEAVSELNNRLKEIKPEKFLELMEANRARTPKNPHLTKAAPAAAADPTIAKAREERAKLIAGLKKRRGDDEPSYMASDDLFAKPRPGESLLDARRRLDRVRKDGSWKDWADGLQETAIGPVYHEFLTDEDVQALVAHPGVERLAGVVQSAMQVLLEPFDAIRKTNPLVGTMFRPNTVGVFLPIVRDGRDGYFVNPLQALHEATNPLANETPQPDVPAFAASLLVHAGIHEITHYMEPEDRSTRFLYHLGINYGRVGADREARIVQQVLEGLRGRNPIAVLTGGRHQLAADVADALRLYEDAIGRAARPGVAGRSPARYSERPGFEPGDADESPEGARPDQPRPVTKDDIVAMLAILDTYKAEGMDFAAAIRQFQDDYGARARDLDRAFEIAWRNRFKEEKKVGDVLGARTIVPAPKPEKPTGPPQPKPLHVRIYDVLKERPQLLDDLAAGVMHPQAFRKEVARILANITVKDLEDHIDALHDATEGVIAQEIAPSTPGPLPKAAIPDAQAIEARMPRAHRTLEKQQLQQFSTPLPIAVLAAHAAQLTPDDLVLEPTAGTGNLLAPILPENDGGPRILAMELSERRADLLRAQGYRVQQGDYLATAPELQPTVIIANPPWGKYSTGKYGRGIALGFAPGDVAERFVGKMLRDLADGGRLVAVMPTTLFDATSFKKWLKDSYAVRAIIQSPPGSYDTRATSVDSVLLVVDKVKGDGTLPAVVVAKDWPAYSAAVEAIHDRAPLAPGARRPTDAAQPPAGSGSGGVHQRPRSGGAKSGRHTPVGTGRGPDVVADGAAGGGGDTVDGGSTPSGAPGTPAGASPAGVPAPPDVTRREATASRLFAPYVRRTTLRGQPHPKLLVEAKQLAGVAYPPLTEKPTASMQKAIDAGRISVEQAEQALAVLQANSGDKPFGYLAADAVGVGKSREIALSILGAMDRAKAAGRELRLMLTTKSRDNVEDLLDEIHYVASGKTATQGGKLPFEVYRLSDDYPGAKKTGNDYEPLPKGTHAVYVVDSYNVAAYRQALADVGLHGIVGDEVQRFTNQEAQIGGAWLNLHARIMRDVPRPEQFFAYFTATPARRSRTTAISTACGCGRSMGSPTGSSS